MQEEPSKGEPSENVLEVFNGLKFEKYDTFEESSLKSKGPKIRLSYFYGGLLTQKKFLQEELYRFILCQTSMRKSCKKRSHDTKK
jgi:hypothetical protein